MTTIQDKAREEAESIVRWLCDLDKEHEIGFGRYRTLSDKIEHSLLHFLIQESNPLVKTLEDYVSEVDSPTKLGALRPSFEGIKQALAEWRKLEESNRNGK